MKACIVMQILLLQKPSKQSKSKDHVSGRTEVYQLYDDASRSTCNKSVTNQLLQVIFPEWSRQSASSSEIHVSVPLVLLSLNDLLPNINITIPETSYETPPSKISCAWCSSEWYTWTNTICKQWNHPSSYHAHGGLSGLDTYAWRHLCSSFGNLKTFALHLLLSSYLMLILKVWRPLLPVDWSP